ncbi:MAG: hypothetical protein AAB571_02625 [Chloroflexota bacterium]
MAIINHIRKLNREDDGVSLRINLEDWATDVPLPPHTSLLGFGENYELLIYPEWRFVFRPNETYDVLTGMFKVPMPFADAVAWSQSQLKKTGWVEMPESTFIQAEWATLKFEFPHLATRVTMSFRWRSEPLNDTQITIWRVTKHLASDEPISDSQLSFPIQEEAVK